MFSWGLRPRLYAVARFADFTASPMLNQTRALPLDLFNLRRLVANETGFAEESVFEKAVRFSWIEFDVTMNTEIRFFNTTSVSPPSARLYCPRNSARFLFGLAMIFGIVKLFTVDFFSLQNFRQPLRNQIKHAGMI